MKFLIIFIAVFSFADVVSIINLIKKIENRKIECKNINNYNIFYKEQKKVILPNKTEVKKIKLKLSAIFQNKALINGKWVKINDIIEGFKILKILPDRVLLKKENKIYVLKSTLKVLKVKR